MLRTAKILMAIAAAMPGLSLPATAANDAKSLAFDFCYAVQAVGLCDGLIMRVDTEKRLTDYLGHAVRGAESPVNDACSRGFDAAWDDEAESGNGAFCAEAMFRFGCSGSRRTGLLMESPFGNRQARTCSFLPP